MPAQVKNEVRLSMAEKRLNSGEISYNLFVIYYAIEFGPYKKLCDNIEMPLCL